MEEQNNMWYWTTFQKYVFFSDLLGSTVMTQGFKSIQPSDPNFKKFKCSACEFIYVKGWISFGCGPCHLPSKIHVQERQMANNLGENDPIF